MSPNVQQTPRQQLCFSKGGQTKVSCLVFFIPPSHILNGALTGALGGQSTSLIMTCYKYPFLKYTKIMNGVAFLQLNCSIRTVLHLTLLCVCALDKHIEGCLDAVLYGYSNTFMGDPAPPVT